MIFQENGHANTEQTLNIALQYAKAHGIRYLVVASVSGATVQRLISEAKRINIVCVSHVAGFNANGEQEMDRESRTMLETEGIRVITGTHVLSGAERGLSKVFGGVYPVEIMAYTLRMFGQGVKVGVEISIMALDAGVIPAGEAVIAIGGSEEGADTAILLTPAHAQRVLETRIHEIICKPY